MTTGERQALHPRVASLTQLFSDQGGVLRAPADKLAGWYADQLARPAAERERMGLDLLAWAVKLNRVNAAATGEARLAAVALAALLDPRGAMAGHLVPTGVAADDRSLAALQARLTVSAPGGGTQLRAGIAPRGRS